MFRLNKGPYWFDFIMKGGSMKAHTASLINALILIGFGLWAYLGSDTPSKTALIPAGFGAVLLSLYKGVEKENKIIAHIAVLLTLLIVILL